MIVATEAGLAWVEPAQNSCAACAAGQGCAAVKLSRLWRNGPERYQVLNPIAATVGERVQVAVPERALLAAAGVAYLLPLLGLFTGALAAVFALPQWPADGSAALGAAMGLLLGIYLPGKLIAKHRLTLPVVSARLAVSTCQRLGE